jgi:polyhydroxybutyrate depolymerase
MRYVIPLALLLGSACHRGPSLAAGAAERTFASGGIPRTYVVHASPNATKAALVIVLHGRGGSGANIERRTHFDAVADRAGIVAVYPDAVGGRWNDGWETSSTDDVAFLAALADSLVSEYGIDRNRVYAAGLSNGACMAHRFACERDTVAAIAAVAGDMAWSLRAPCATGRAISVVEMHGKDDGIVPYDGELAATVATWVARDGCGPSESKMLPDVDPNDGTRVRLDRYASCRDATEVAFYTIEGGGHSWPGGEPLANPYAGKVSHDIDASAVIWDFFSTKTRSSK